MQCIVLPEFKNVKNTLLSSLERMFYLLFECPWILITALDNDECLQKESERGDYEYTCLLARVASNSNECYLRQSYE